MINDSNLVYANPSRFVMSSPSSPRERWTYATALQAETNIPRKTPTIHSHGTVMNTSRPHIIVLPTRQKAFADAAINHKKDLCRYLRTQKAGLLHAGYARVFPLRKVFGWPHCFDGSRSLIMASLVML